MTQDDLLNARYHARSLHEHAYTAYWLKGRADTVAQMMIRDAHEDFAALAEAMGYTVTPIAQEVAA